MTDIMDRAVADAQRRTSDARHQLLITTGEIRRRLKPRSLAAAGLDAAVARVQTLARSTQGSARRNPGRVAGAIAALFGAFALRFWLRRRKSSKPNETGT